MIKKLRARIKRLGMNQVSTDLGYRSTTTIYNWLRKNEIPKSRKQKIREYLKVVK